MASKIVDKINKLTKREKNIVGILIVVLSTIPFFYTTMPVWNKYLDSIGKITQDKKRLSDLGIQIKRLEKFKTRNLDLSKKIENQKLYLAKSYEIDFLVQDLKKICDESSISLESFTPSDPEPVNIVLEKQTESDLQATTSKGSKKRGSAKLKETLEKLKGEELPVDLYRYPIEVKVSGNFTDILELFKKLEKYGRVISVENISLSKVQAKQDFGNRLTKSKSKKENTETGSLLGSFDLVAYSLPRDEEKLPFSQLGKKSGGSKSTFSIKKKRT